MSFRIKALDEINKLAPIREIQEMKECISNFAPEIDFQYFILYENEILQEKLTSKTIYTCKVKHEDGSFEKVLLLPPNNDSTDLAICEVSHNVPGSYSHYIQKIAEDLDNSNKIPNYICFFLAKKPNTDNKLLLGFYYSNSKVVEISLK